MVFIGFIAENLSNRDVLNIEFNSEFDLCIHTLTMAKTICHNLNKKRTSSGMCEMENRYN